ncbi:uncharacterized protein LOC132713810 [Ruditapes philippinarum]|uniref:uncharacterized protein LOC132713810 n=1 Tax=Ruditapes philippinarum TaxID=129788 RepID=UPI00295ACB7B|nr:uncharacterized protein LOC132713810 [Ruditapes philippinarum]
MKYLLLYIECSELSFINFAGDHNGLLLGGSGYPCRSFLMTPFLNPQGDARCRFNESLCHTRVLIEQTFGILKRRFQILHYEMDVQPNQAVVNTVASAVLHNIGIIRGDIINNESSTDPDNDNDTAPQHNGIQDGSTMREHIVQNYFS